MTLSTMNFFTFIYVYLAVTLIAFAAGAVAHTRNRGTRN